MSSVHNSVDTVNAAATAIVTAETRTQPDTIPKKKWGSCWSHYWCFGSYKHKKRIGHATLVPEPTEPVATAPISENPNHSAASSIVIPFIAPPSSPASFLLSDPPSATQSPAGLLSLKSLSFNAYSPGGTASIFTIGPYAHETQLVTPPAFSAVTTEPSTACFTPPPESTQLTTPPSPEVPFAQLLTSSLACNRRNSGTNLQFSLSQYEFQPYQYPGSPGSRLISPGSVVSNSGTSSPFTDKCTIVGLCKGEAPKYIGYEHFSTRKWGSRVGSGSLTPNGWGSRLGSGAQTPNGGSLSRLGSGTVTPNGAEPPSRDSYFPESQISEVASLANSDNGYEDEDIAVAHHRVSFELTGEEVPSCREKENAIPEPPENHNASLQISYCPVGWRLMGADDSYQSCVEESTNTIPGNNALEGGGELLHCQKHRNITLGSSKDFDFDYVKPEALDKSAVDCEWWTNDKESDVEKSWTFFPVLKHHEVS